MTFHPHRYKPKANKFSNPFSRVPTLGQLAKGTGGWPAGYGPGTAKKLSKQYLRKKKGGSNGIAQGRVMNEGTGGQFSMFNGPRHKSYLPKHVENALAPLVYQANAAYQLLSTVGKQNVLIPLGLNNPSITTGVTSDSVSNMMFVETTGDVTMNNIYLSNVYIIIYDVFARKDIGTANVGTPLLAWTQGNSDEGSANAYAVLGSTPWQSEAFNQFYRVAQVTNVVLAAGGTHVHKVRLHPNRLVNGSYATYTPYGFRDLTYWTMIEIHGSPANDTTTQTQVSIGVGGLNIIADQEHKTKQIAKQTPIIVSVNSLRTTPFTVAEQVVNMGGTTIVAQAEG